MSSAKDRGELTITLRMKGRPVVLVGEGAIADEHRGLLKRAGAFIVAEGSKAAFAIVVDDPAAVSRLKVRGCLVYAVGQPELSDFTLASPAPTAKSPPAAKVVAPAKVVALAKAAAPAKAARTTEGTVAEPGAPATEPAVEPAPAAMAVTPEFEEPRPAATQPKTPRPERVPVEIKMPQVSFEPVIRAAQATGQLARQLSARSGALVSPLFRMSTPFTRKVASNIQDRIDRARERPISLDLALVKGGLLDHERETTKPETTKPAGSAPQASPSPDTVPPTPATHPLDPTKS